MVVTVANNGDSAIERSLNSAALWRRNDSALVELENLRAGRDGSSHGSKLHGKLELV